MGEAAVEVGDVLGNGDGGTGSHRSAGAPRRPARPTPASALSGVPMTSPSRSSTSLTRPPAHTIYFIRVCRQEQHVTVYEFYGIATPCSKVPKYSSGLNFGR